MIDKIIELILQEARARSREDPVANIYSVLMDIGNKVDNIMANVRMEERKEKNENA